MTTATPGASPTFSGSLRNLYLVRFAFALIWAVVLIFTGGAAGALLTVLLVVYPLVDALAVLWQLRSEGEARAPRVTEAVNVVVSVLAAVALGLVSTVSLASVMVAWGAWAAVAGVVQLITAIRRRGLGGQVPQIVSGALSVLIGITFVLSASRATGLSGIGGYAIGGGILFLISAIRLSVLLRKG